MTSYVTPKKGSEFIFYAGVQSQGTAGTFQSNPTIAAGDFKYSGDGGSLTNLATLPAVTPASSKIIKFVLSATETNFDNIVVLGSDASGSEWCDFLASIQTSARQVDDLAYPTTSGRSIDVTAGGGVGVDWSNVENPTTVLDLSGTTIATSQVVASVTGAVGSVTGAVGSVTGAVGSVTGNVGGNVTGSVGSVAAGGITSGSFGAGAIDASAIAADAIGSSELAASAVSEIVTGVLTTQMTEAYAADGVAPTLAQAIFALQQFQQEKSISGVTLTIKKLDGSTDAMTFTLDDATNPTSVTRST